ncbi:plasmid stabilization system protein [Rhizobium freirei PRF 81]|uniref:Plasmid stabilization system protein n=2 Tax=Rhizobium TaxID=379 RepID=N6U1S6_9HYPH|nr:plasmid stabilization system protein [Rhizobium tropici CIAT 899]AYG77015.1 type II toxin-antitoxin system RelE/ParE family toxin [Rhizobium sp. CCGE532]ENN86569.1 plasmid stabilization system protein [Rhizobium freirei PRF 81]NEV14399.1 type II toxin-antitoxin system RelE/ParE family toxin [Rhizobium tropici]TGE88700.1 type II toxin-antitoxin system RelE/ParE family toxin [Rhizobium sp. SEMIA 4088]
MHFNFSLSVEAEEDIIAIAEQGVSMFGSTQARRYHDDLFAVLDLIAANPRMARELEEISPPLEFIRSRPILLSTRSRKTEQFS